MTAPYYADEAVTLYHGDMRDVLPTLNLTADCVVTDPPYGETSLPWDRWPDGWPTLAAQASRSMWCFGSLRMFLDRRDEFAGWKLSQDVVWEKNQGSGLAADRFRRVHEHSLHWYQGDWAAIYKDPPREPGGIRPGAKMRRSGMAAYTQGARAALTVEGDGFRLMRSVLCVDNMRVRSLHPTEKPIGILDPLIRYACPPGGLVLDLFAGSGSTLVAARESGRRAIGIEADEAYCEKAAKRLAQHGFDFGDAS